MSYGFLQSMFYPIHSREMFLHPSRDKKEISEILSSEPLLYWYPGCGHDLTPLLLDLPNNPTGQRLYPLRGEKQEKNLLLWMSDYVDDTLLFLSGVKEDGLQSPQMSRLGSFSIEGPVEHYGLMLFDLTFRHYMPGVVPLSVFHVRVKSKRRKPHQRPEEGDLYTVIFSFCESEILLRQVFLRHSVQVSVVAIIGQSSWGCMRKDFNQRTDLPRLLGETGKVEAYITDIDIFPGYEPSGMAIEGWGSGKARLFRRSAQEIDNTSGD